MLYNCTVKHSTDGLERRKASGSALGQRLGHIEGSGLRGQGSLGFRFRLSVGVGLGCAMNKSSYEGLLWMYKG